MLRNFYYLPDIYQSQMSLGKATHALVNRFWHPSDKTFTREGRGPVHSGALLYLTLQIEGEAWGHGVEGSWEICDRGNERMGAWGSPSHTHEPTRLALQRP